MRSLLEKDCSGRVEVMSAGIAAATDFPATRYAAEAARIWDLDLGSHRSQALTMKLLETSDLIIAMAPEHHRAIVDMSPEAQDKTFLLKSFPDNDPMGEQVEDPIGLSLADYNETFLEIGEYLGKILPLIVSRIDEKSNA